MKLQRNFILYPAGTGDARRGISPYPATMMLSVQGSRGAITWTILTDWHLKEIQNEERYNRGQPIHGMRPEGRGINCHKRALPGDAVIDKKCDLIGGVACAMDGSSLLAIELMPEFIEKGSEWAYEKLEELYGEWL